MTTRNAITAICLMLLLSACSGDKQAAQLLETALFEEKQSNIAHAIKLYNEIIQKHPDSSSALKAKSRLSELNKKP
jgi:TolA-binding protein